MSIYADFWAALGDRDWDRFGATLAEGVVVTWPQSRERLVGRDALVAFEAAYPGDWRLELVTEHADERGAATQVAFTLDDETVPGLTFFTLDDGGSIATIVEFWPDPYDPPERSVPVERY